MKRIAVLFVLVFCSAAANPRQSPSDELKPNAAATQSSVSSPAEARMQALEDQVHTLADEVALLRGELQALRDANSTEPPFGGRVLLASSHVEPGMLPPAAPPPMSASAAPDPSYPQAAQTQTFGGATSNAKLLNPDISLIGDFIGTAGHNPVSPSPARLRIPKAKGLPS